MGLRLGRSCLCPSLPVSKLVGDSPVALEVTHLCVRDRSSRCRDLSVVLADRRPVIWALVSRGRLLADVRSLTSYNVLRKQDS